MAGPFNLPDPSQQRTVGGFTPPYGSGVGAGSPPPISGVPGQRAPLSTEMRYRPDAGQYLTDQNYTEWQQQQPLKALQGQTDIQTNAASRLGKEQAGYETSMESQKENFATQQAKLEAELAGQAATQKEALGEKAFGSRASALSGLMSGFTGGTGAGGPVAPIQPDIAGEEAEQNAAFARAKDQAGSIGRSAVNALQDTMGARGITGSGLGVSGVGNVIGQEASQLGDVNRQQLIDAQQLARQRASQTYQGNITQRGQNLGAIQGLIGAIGSGISY